MTTITKPKPATLVRRTKGAVKVKKVKVAPTLSLHQRILNDIEQNILSGHWEPGHRIPSEHELANEYKCSRMTVNKVLTQLARANMVERRRKAGSFVTRSHSTSAVLEINDIRAEVLALGQPYRFELVGHKKRRSLRADMAALGLAQAGPVLELRSLHFAGARPFCLEYRLINLTAVPQAAAEPFVDEPPGAWLFSHVPWTSAEHRIRAGASGAEMSSLLQVDAGTPCLVVQRRTWTGSSPVTFVRVTYPGEDHELVAHFSPTTVGKPG
jgi:GntR family histidine utilization transcriptional repressor